MQQSLCLQLCEECLAFLCRYSTRNRIDKDVEKIIKAGKQYNETVSMAFPIYAGILSLFQVLLRDSQLCNSGWSVF